jgi:hypothetical protein
LLNKIEKHLRDWSAEELAELDCTDCLLNNMAEYACINHMKDNEAVCVYCCYCHREEV